MLRDFFETGVGMALIYFLVILALIAGGFVSYQVFVEPRVQEAYQQEVASKLNDYCMAAADDPWNQGTVSSLMTNVNGEPTRFTRLPYALQNQATAAIRGDRVGACGAGAK